MRARLFLFCFASLLLASARAQTTASDPSRPASSSTASRPAARPGAKGPLPDPVLLDGSNQPAEKKPERGMLGEFEIPGDENSKSGKVGGQQNPNQQGGGGGGQQQPQNQAQNGGKAGGMPQGGGAGGQPPAGAQTAQQGGGGAAGGQPPPNQSGQAGTAGAAGGDPNGKAEGIQVAGLEGDSSGAGPGGAGGAAGDNVPKPQQVSIGDPTMQIKPVANAPGVVGQVTAGSTQQMESKIGKGSGGGGGSPTTGGGGKGVEKGRTMPSGL
jgi:hypothetical protein